MTPHVVVDIGNTRIKWGRCAARRAGSVSDRSGVSGSSTPVAYASGSPSDISEIASLPPDDEHTWQAQLERWPLPPHSQWVIAGAHPTRCHRLAEWLQRRGEHVRIVKHPDELPLRTLLEHPEKTGIDRLL